jgi:hypothetical protein
MPHERDYEVGAKTIPAGGRTLSHANLNSDVKHGPSQVKYCRIECDNVTIRHRRSK